MRSDRPARDRPTDPWGLGHYPSLARRLEPAAEAIAGLAGSGADRPALDVAAGDGSVAAHLASAGWRVTATDGSPRMVALGRERLEGSGVRWQQADVTAQPVADHSQDLVTSSFGLIFGEDVEACVAEVARVLAVGGRLVMTSWSAGGYMMRMSAVMSEFFEGATNGDRPGWGHESFVRERLSRHFASVVVCRSSLPWCFASPQEGRRFLETTSPAHIAACQALEGRAEEMMDALERHLEGYARSDGSVALAAEFLVVEAVRGS